MINVCGSSEALLSDGNFLQSPIVSKMNAAKPGRLTELSAESPEKFQ